MYVILQLLEPFFKDIAGVFSLYLREKQAGRIFSAVI